MGGNNDFGDKEIIVKKVSLEGLRDIKRELVKLFKH